MNLYLLVEGETEPRLYPDWLKILAPHMNRVDFIENINSNNFYIKGGLGYPGILDKDTGLKNTLSDISLNKKIDQLWIICDADDCSIEDRENEIRNRINEVLSSNNQLAISHCDIHIIIQKVCIETWGLANSRVFPTNNIIPPFDKYANFYNVSVHDPELMPVPPNNQESIGEFHHQYLKNMLRARSNKIRYTKCNPSPLNKDFYLNEIIARIGTNHCSSFKKFYDLALSL
ncbi:hypothetical protein R5B80_12945 [Acinetobacter baumannii]|nr:hypothetical protein [Acinetobacter baumannii]